MAMAEILKQNKSDNSTTDSNNKSGEISDLHSGLLIKYLERFLQSAVKNGSGDDNKLNLYQKAGIKKSIEPVIDADILIKEQIYEEEKDSPPIVIEADREVQDVLSRRIEAYGEIGKREREACTA